MRIAFIGLGSIAKRHIRNLSGILKERGIGYQIDVCRHGQTYIEDDDIRGVVSEVYSEKEFAGQEYDIIFITNPTSLHFETIRRYLGSTRHMFIEKPVFSDNDVDIKKLQLRPDGVYYVACPLRYTSVLQYVKKTIDFSKVYSIRAISSSYLPDWRPGIDYRDTYSAHRNLGGGVAIDLIHEWDYLTAFCGFPDKVMYAGGKTSRLEIDSDDLAAYIGVYEDKIIELHLDYFGRKTIREMMIFTEDDIIRADLTNSRIVYEKSGFVKDLKEDRDAYQKRELEHFLDIIDGKCPNDNNIENALRVLKLAKGR